MKILSTAFSMMMLIGPSFASEDIRLLSCLNEGHADILILTHPQFCLMSVEVDGQQVSHFPSCEVDVTGEVTKYSLIGNVNMGPGVDLTDTIHISNEGSQDSKFFHGTIDRTYGETTSSYEITCKPYEPSSPEVRL